MTCSVPLQFMPYTRKKQNNMVNKNILSVSGGKDSTAMWLWAIEQGIEADVVFADTGHEHPVTYGYLEYLESKLGPIRRVKADFTKRIEERREYVQTKWREEGVSESIIENALFVLQPTGIPYLDLCLWKGMFPRSTKQFCTQFLKIEPIEQQIYGPLIEKGIDVTVYQAVRADESKRRAKLPQTEITIGIVYAYVVQRPLLNWKVDEVFDIHRRYDIMPNPLYLKGMTRVGCMPCIHERKDSLFEIGQRWPEQIERLAEWERLVSLAAKYGHATFFPISDGTGDGIHEVVEWSKTARGGKQYDLFKITDDIPMCRSAYGLCE